MSPSNTNIPIYPSSPLVQTQPYRINVSFTSSTNNIQGRGLEILPPLVKGRRLEDTTLFSREGGWKIHPYIAQGRRLEDTSLLPQGSNACLLLPLNVLGYLPLLAMSSPSFTHRRRLMSPSLLHPPTRPTFSILILHTRKPMSPSTSTIKTIPIFQQNATNNTP